MSYKLKLWPCNYLSRVNFCLFYLFSRKAFFFVPMYFSLQCYYHYFYFFFFFCGLITQYFGCWPFYNILPINSNCCKFFFSLSCCYYSPFVISGTLINIFCFEKIWGSSVKGFLVCPMVTLQFQSLPFNIFTDLNSRLLNSHANSVTVRMPTIIAWGTSTTNLALAPRPPRNRNRPFDGLLPFPNGPDMWIEIRFATYRVISLFALAFAIFGLTYPALGFLLLSEVRNIIPYYTISMLLILFFKSNFIILLVSFKINPFYFISLFLHRGEKNNEWFRLRKSRALFLSVTLILNSGK